MAGTSPARTAPLDKGKGARGRMRQRGLSLERGVSKDQEAVLAGLVPATHAKTPERLESLG